MLESGDDIDPPGDAIILETFKNLGIFPRDADGSSKDHWGHSRSMGDGDNLYNKLTDESMGIQRSNFQFLAKRLVCAGCQRSWRALYALLSCEDGLGLLGNTDAPDSAETTNEPRHAERTI